MRSILRQVVALLAIASATPAAAAPYAVPKGVGKWGREKGYYRVVRLHHLEFARFQLTHLLDGTTIVMAGRGYIMRPPGSHLWTEHLPPIHSARLWLFSCVGGVRKHLFFAALVWPKWAAKWLCSVQPEVPLRMLIPYNGNGVAGFANGRVGGFTLGSHLVLTADGGRRWLPQPQLGFGRLYRLKWLSDRRLLVAGIKGTLLLAVHSDGSMQVRSRGMALPVESPIYQYSLIPFGWPITWYASYPRPHNKLAAKKPAVLEKLDLKSGKVLTTYKVRGATAFMPFHGGFIAVVPHASQLETKSWIEVYTVEGGKAVLAHKTDSDFWQKVEWRSRGRFVYNGDHAGGLYQLDVHTGVIKPTSIRLKKWIVPPNPNSPDVIMGSKAWVSAVHAVMRIVAKLRGPYIARYNDGFKKLGRPWMGVPPWKSVKANMALAKKLYTEQEKAAGK